MSWAGNVGSQAQTSDVLSTLPLWPSQTFLLSIQGVPLPQGQILSSPPVECCYPFMRWSHGASGGSSQHLSLCCPPASFRPWGLRAERPSYQLEGLQHGDSKLVHHPVTALLAALCPSPGLTFLTGARKWRHCWQLQKSVKLGWYF